jgi:acetyl-CoA carboxylase biotin carboxyl carrier protein
MDLTNEDVADVLAVLDSLPYDELDLQTTRFRLTLRRTPDGWTQSTQVLSEPHPLAAATPAAPPPAPPPNQATARAGTGGDDGTGGDSGSGTAVGMTADGEISGAGEIDGVGEASGTGHGLVAVRAPLPGTFYRAPRPGAEPFVEVGSRVSADTVIGIVETMKLMNSVSAGVGGTVAEICLGNAEFAPHGATLVRIRADP